MTTRTNDEMIAMLRRSGVLRDQRIEAAIRTMDRRKFVLPEYEALAYEDHPLPIGDEQTISQPWTVVYMLELLDVREGMNVLDVGSGSGWTTAILASLVGVHGFVHGREIVPELVVLGRTHLADMGIQNATIEGAGGVLGAPNESPFHRILVSAVSQTLPEELVEQMGVGGRMVIPVAGELLRVTKSNDGEVTITEHGPFVFVPLRSGHGRRWSDSKI